MATVSNISRNSDSVANQSRSTVLVGGAVFYGWLFWFTTSAFVIPPITNQARTTASVINQAKN
jgi:hypothetical protein